MRKARWLVESKNPATAPAISHCLSRVVDRKFVLGDDEREVFRMFMRMYENYSGCRVLAYCLMSNHFHLLLEVPPMPDEELLARLRALYPENFVAGVAGELAEARKSIEEFSGNEALVEAIHQRFTYRMHHLSEFMKGLLIRFTRWYNRKHSRTGTLWEERFKSVIVESGAAARTIAAYIDLNPVRAGMVSDPADYRWSSYGEAIGGGKKGNGKKARAGLVRAWKSSEGIGFDASWWPEVSRLYRRMMGIALDKKAGRANVVKTGRSVTKNTAELLASVDNETSLKDLAMAKMLRCRVRYFTDGVVIGSRDFVNEAFTAARERFGAKRKDGARKLRGNASAAAGTLWSIRALQKGIC